MKQNIVGSVIASVGVGTVSLLAWHIKSRYISSEPNEWLLQIKDGEMIKAAVGITVFRGLGETVVKFPSILNKVEFSAQQVSKEMQGVELSGFAIWVVNRDGNSPLKAYKHIKDLANLSSDSEVNQHIKSMAESIVRHEIANLSINDVISKRKEVRDGITRAMQEILGGWGIWLETVEITDVKILSGSLFNDLQQPFRSSTNQTAEKIRIDTEHDLSEKRVMTQFKMNKVRNEKDTEIAIERSRMALKKEEAEQKILDQREEIKRANIEMRKKTAILQSQMDAEIQAAIDLSEIQAEHDLSEKRVMTQFEMNKVRNAKDTEIAIERSRMALKKEEAEQKILDQREEIKRANIEMRKKTAILQSQMDAEIQAQKQQVEQARIEHQIAMQEKENDWQLKKKRDGYEVDAAMGDVNFQKQILTSFENMYKNMNVREMKIVNFGHDAGLEQGLGKFAAALKQVTGQLNNNDE